MFRRGKLQSPYLVTVAVGVLYLGLLAWLWGHFNGDPLGFVHRGTVFSEGNPAGTRGYDGQFYYYTAVDPGTAAAHMDNATFRLQRIFYPLVIMAVSLGQRDLVPYAMLLINYLSVLGCTLLAALLLARWGRSPWFALGYSLCAGVPVALTFDTAEPLAFALVALGVYLLDRANPRINHPPVPGNPDPGPPSPMLMGRRERLGDTPTPPAGTSPLHPQQDKEIIGGHPQTPGREEDPPKPLSSGGELGDTPKPPAGRSPHPYFSALLLGSALAFAAALLTRELALYFVVAYGLVAAYLIGKGILFGIFRGGMGAVPGELRRGPREAGPVLLVAIAAFVPVTLWTTYLSVTSRYLGVSFVQPFEHIPFLAYWLQLGHPTARSVSYAAQYIVPTTVFGLLGLWQLVRTWRWPSPLLVALLGNVHLMTFLPHLGYQHQVASSRYLLGLSLAAVLWAGGARPRWMLWLTLLFALTFLAYVYGLIRQDPAYLW